MEAIGKFEKIDPELLKNLPSGEISIQHGELKTSNQKGKKVFWEQGDDLFLSIFRHGKTTIFHNESNFQKSINIKPTFKSICLDWGESIGFALFWFSIISTWFLASFVVPSKSMIPNLEVGDKLFGLKFSYYFSDPEIGSMVIFEPPASVQRADGELWVKRIIAGPGDIVVVEKGSVYVNGKVLEEPYTLGNKTSAYSGKYNEGFYDGPKMKETKREWRIPEEGEKDSGWFVLGDNRENSFDSRSFGLVPNANIRGKPWLIWAPSKRRGVVPNLQND